MLERAFYLVWTLIGILALLLIAFILYEWVDHGASWDGLFNAIIKHVNKACVDVKPLELNFCKK